MYRGVRVRCHFKLRGTITWHVLWPPTLPSTMPTGTPHDSFLEPCFPGIRVDDFTDNRPAAAYFLTHTHSDHVTGLQAKSFGSLVYCSLDAKQMLLNHETYKKRSHLQDEYIANPERTYAHLQTGMRRSEEEVAVDGSRDLLVCYVAVLTYRFSSYLRKPCHFMCQLKSTFRQANQ
jgi:hypothetical protein